MSLLKYLNEIGLKYAGLLILAAWLFMAYQWGAAHGERKGYERGYERGESLYRELYYDLRESMLYER